MYRQIIVSNIYWKYEKVLWRLSKDLFVKTYELNTIIHGITSSSFLALRVLKDLAEHEKFRFPETADTLQSDVFVDDIVTDATSIEKAIQLQKILIELLKSGGFELRK